MHGCGSDAPQTKRLGMSRSTLQRPGSTARQAEGHQWSKTGHDGRCLAGRKHMACKRGGPWTSCKLAVYLLLTTCLHTCVHALDPAAGKQPPNFLIVLTDDQDYLMDGSARKYMPKLHSLMGDEGLELRNFVVSMAWCCPSRASLLTGRYVHNTNITSSSMPRGGAEAFMRSDLPADYLPVWLQDLGYNTYFAGKFLNSLQQTSPKHCPKGWTVFEGLLDGFNHTYRSWYTNSVYSNNCNGTQSFFNTYQTDIVRDKGLSMINTAVQSGKPFFIQLAPVAPHDQGDGKVAVPADRDKDAFPDAVMPQSPNWGVPLPTTQFLSNAAPSNKTFSQSKWLQRQRTIVAVDDMMETLLMELDRLGQLNNTYIIYTSDNGFHLGQHGLTYEKFTPYEEDVRVPMFIRGPGIPHGIKSDYPATMVDITATVMTLAGGPLLPQLDGVPFPLQAIAAGRAGSVYMGDRSPSPAPLLLTPIHMMEGDSVPIHMMGDSTQSPSMSPPAIPVHMLGDSFSPPPASIPVHMLGDASSSPLAIPVHMLGDATSSPAAAAAAVPVPVHMLGDPVSSPAAAAAAAVPVHMLGDTVSSPPAVPIHMMAQRHVHTQASVGSAHNDSSSSSDSYSRADSDAGGSGSRAAVTVPASPPPPEPALGSPQHAGAASNSTANQTSTQLGDISSVVMPSSSYEEYSNADYDIIYAPYDEGSPSQPASDSSPVTAEHSPLPAAAPPRSPHAQTNPSDASPTLHHSNTFTQAGGRNGSTLPPPPDFLTSPSLPAAASSMGLLSPTLHGNTSATAGSNMSAPVGQDDDPPAQQLSAPPELSEAAVHDNTQERSPVASPSPQPSGSTLTGNETSHTQPVVHDSPSVPPSASHNATAPLQPTGQNATLLSQNSHNSQASAAGSNITSLPTTAPNSTTVVHSPPAHISTLQPASNQTNSTVQADMRQHPSQPAHNASSHVTLPQLATSPQLHASPSPRLQHYNASPPPLSHTTSAPAATTSNTTSPPGPSTLMPANHTSQPQASPTPPASDHTTHPSVANNTSTPPLPPSSNQSSSSPMSDETSQAAANHNSPAAAAHVTPSPSPAHVTPSPSPAHVTPSPSPAMPSHSMPDMGNSNARQAYIRDTIMIEGWLDITSPRLYRKAYRSVRVCTPYTLPTASVRWLVDYQVFMGFTCYKYTVWCIPKNPHTKKDSVLRELYVLSSDPYEMANLLPSQDVAVQKLVQRLDAVLTVMAYCKGATCRLPWLVLHPDGAALSLADAMNTTYDAQYAAYTTFSYNKCSVWYDPADEQADADILLLLAQAQAVADGNPYASEPHIGGDYADYGNNTSINGSGEQEDSSSGASPSKQQAGSYWGWMR